MSSRFLTAGIALAAFGATPVTARACGADVPDVPGVVFAGCPGETVAHLSLVGEEGVEPQDTLTAFQRITVTGAYTSGEKREPEGMFIVAGVPLDPYPQGWDGVVVIDGQGRLSLHYAERVDIGAERFNLRRKPSRRAFVQAAKGGGWSAFQSHMLVIDGKVDTKPLANAPRFARRLLYTLRDGSVGIYETPSLTLHDAALAIEDALSPVMALNLDMGSYDYCRIEGERARMCGALVATQTAKLSNLLTLSRGTAEDVAGVE